MDRNIKSKQESGNQNEFASTSNADGRSFTLGSWNGKINKLKKAINKKIKAGKYYQCKMRYRHETDNAIGLENSFKKVIKAPTLTKALPSKTKK